MRYQSSVLLFGQKCPNAVKYSNYFAVEETKAVAKEGAGALTSVLCVLSRLKLYQKIILLLLLFIWIGLFLFLFLGLYLNQIMTVRKI